MTFIPKNIRDKDKSVGYVKTEELLKGKWEIISMEVIVSRDSKFGADSKDALFKNEVLKEGETLRYIFKDDTGAERTYESKGLAFYLAFKEKDEEVSTGDKITFARDGAQTDTRWSIKKV